MRHIIMREVLNMESVTMKACVLQVNDCDLLVRDCSTRQEVVVHSDRACRFSVGDTVCIVYNGVMTMSIPPQISAMNIRKISC